MLNEVLGGHYRVVQDLQEGGLAKTYIVEDHHRPGHPKCAVKFLKPASKDSEFLPTARRLFNQEAEILEKLGQHDQIPRLLAYFEENQEFYLVQEFIEGHTLTMELPRGHCWSESKVVEMLQDVLPTLEFVHGHGVIHRDIKPNNLIRREQDDRLVLIDFGAVKQIRAHTIVSHLPINQKTISIGTHGYMPTEQVRGKPRLNSDIYALGMIGIQALTGVYPIDLQEDAEGEVIWRNLARVSNELAEILTNMVRYHFKDRYQSATEVLLALQPLAYYYGLLPANSDPASPKVVPESKLPEQKVDPDINHSRIPRNSEAARETELWDAKINSDIQQLNSGLVPKSEYRKQKLSLGTDPQALNLNRFSEAQLVFPPGSLPPPKDDSSILSWLFRKKYHLLIGVGMGSVLLSMFTSYYHIKHKQSYFQAQGALEQIDALKVAAKYQECLQQAQIFPQDYSDLNAELETILSQCHQGHAQKQLAEARELAAHSKLQDAIAKAGQITSDKNIYQEAQQLIDQWSKQILQVAHNEYQKGKLSEAKAIAGAISADNPWAQEARETIQQWDEEWQQNENYLQEAQKKLDERRWHDAIKEAQKVSKNKYWQTKSASIIQKALAGIYAARKPVSLPPKPTPFPKTVSPPPKPTPFPKTVSSPPKPTPSLQPEPIIRKSQTERRGTRKPSQTKTERRPTEWECMNNPNPKCRQSD